MLHQHSRYENRYLDFRKSGPLNALGVTGEMIMAAANAAQSLQEAAGAPVESLDHCLDLGNLIL